MPDMTIYLPDELHRQVKDAELPASKVAQQAFAKELTRLRAAREQSERITVKVGDEWAGPWWEESFDGRWLVRDVEIELPVADEHGEHVADFERSVSVALTARGRIALHWKSLADFQMAPNLLDYDSLDAAYVANKEAKPALDQAAEELKVNRPEIWRDI